MRFLLDKLFTALAWLSVLTMAGALLLILVPIFWGGSKAVIFDGTVEFRKLQLYEEMFNRGDPEELQRELAKVREARAPVYEIVNSPFARAMMPERFRKEVRKIYYDLGDQLRARVGDDTMTRDEMRELRREARGLRKHLEAAAETDDRTEALEHVAAVLEYDNRDAFKGTRGETFFEMAEAYGQVVRTVDLGRREEFAEEVEEVKGIVRKLFGPPEGEEPNALMQFRYGATRMSQVDALVHELRWKTVYVEKEGQGLLQPTEVSREEIFAGTPFEPLFPLVKNNIHAMMLPEFTVYWQYFIDEAPPGHYHGGVLPEILGTIYITVLTILVATPVGIITAAYLVEYTSENKFIKIIRMCINTLAGVPSIVFGLFGLAFFVLTMPDWFNGAQEFLFGAVLIEFHRETNILAGALTLAVMVLPVIIRASEEAIRAVPPSYREASLALGAGGLRTFVTVTLPAALPGILTGIILSMSRAAGETAPLLFTAATASITQMPDSIMRGSAKILSYGAYDIAMNDNIATLVPHQQYGMTMTLILIVLLLNITAIVIRSKVAKKLRG